MQARVMRQEMIDGARGHLRTERIKIVKLPENRHYNTSLGKGKNGGRI